jgi:hypothetical protein
MLIDRLTQELTATLEAHDAAENPGQSADQLLERDGSRQLLIGITAAGDAVLVHDRVDETVVRVEIHHDGIDWGDREQVADARSLDQVWGWIQQRETDAFAWLHPRYRWVFGDDYRPESG